MPGRDVDTALRIVHDLTQSIWLGGATMGAVALDAAAQAGPDQAAQIAGLDRAWSRWHRISTPTIVAHLVAGVGLTIANRDRLVAQSGAARTTLWKTAFTGAALASEIAARKLGARIGQQTPGATTSTDPADLRDQTPDASRRRLTAIQWTTVASAAAMVAVGARMGEQQRPRELRRGIAARLGLAA